MHAYLILAHNEFDILEKLVKSIDDERNSIFIHIDKKVKNFDFDRFLSLTQKSKLAFTDKRINIKWGDFNMIEAEYALLEKAFENGEKYDYVHLISGVDIPLMNQNSIHSFFENNNGKEFVHFTHEKLNDTELDRVRAYHFATGRRNLINRFITKLESTFARISGINRIKNLEVQKGGQWFSITGDFAKYILSKKDFVYHQFKHTFIPDEFFVQTLLINSDYKQKLYHKEFDNSPYANMHYSDWQRGTPYTFTIDDKDEIDDMDFLFVRKFSSKVDSEIVDYLFEKIK